MTLLIWIFITCNRKSFMRLSLKIYKKNSVAVALVTSNHATLGLCYYTYIL